MRAATYALAFLLSALVGSETFAALPGVGAPAPDFAVKSSTGRNIRLSELRGQVVLINFWASWCGPCRQELPALDRLQEQYRATGFTLLAVNIDEQQANADGMLRKLNVRMPAFYDNDQRVAKAYDVDTMPATLIVDRSGRVRYIHRGFVAGYEKKYEQEIRELLKQ